MRKRYAKNTGFPAVRFMLMCQGMPDGAGWGWRRLRACCGTTALHRKPSGREPGRRRVVSGSRWRTMPAIWLKQYCFSWCEEAVLRGLTGCGQRGLIRAVPC